MGGKRWVDLKIGDVVPAEPAPEKRAPEVLVVVAPGKPKKQRKGRKTDARPGFVRRPRVALAEGAVLHRKAAEPAPKKRRKTKPVAAGHDGRFEAGSRVVDDPYEAGAKLTARVNLAEHPLELMRAKGRLTEAHYVAGVKFRAICERAMIGAARGIDPAKVKVDGGRAGDVLEGGVAEAHADLKRLAKTLGLIGYRLCEEVCGRGVPVAVLARVWPAEGGERSIRDYLTYRFDEALEVLAAEVWGATGPARGRTAAWQDGAERADAHGVDDAVTAEANARFWRKRGMA